MILSSINYVYLETTNYCNLSCVGCNRGDVIGPLKHMSGPTFKKVLDKINHHPISEAKLMGMGEPFLNPEFFLITKYFRQTFPKAFVISATNCQYTPNYNLSKSLEYLDMLYLSIDGVGDVFEKLRPPGKWAKTLAFLDYISRANRYNCLTPINFTIFPDNIHQIPEVLKLTEFYRLSELRLNLAQDWNEDTNAAPMFSRDDLDYLKQYHTYIKGKSHWDYPECFWPKTGLYMTVEGNVKTCCMNTGGITHGNIFKDSIDDIRIKSSFIKIRSSLEENKPTGHCLNCSYNALKPQLKEILG